MYSIMGNGNETIKMNRAQSSMALNSKRHWGPLKYFEQRSNLARAYAISSRLLFWNELGKGEAEEWESIKR